MDPQLEQVERSLEVLFEPNDTIELRCVGSRPINGYYRDQDKLAADARRLNQDFNPQNNVFVCLNPVLPDLYARQADEFGYTPRGNGTKDQDVRVRRWLLVDIDSVRPQGVSATETQKLAATALATQVYRWLQTELGQACLVCADSGNGAHILIRLPDVPADEQSRWVCERFLAMLADRFSSPDAKVDTTTFNAARICTLYGTVKRKGSDIPEQPHRLSKLVYVPDPLQPVDWQQLASLVDPYPGHAQQTAVQSATGDSGLDIDELLQQRGHDYRRDDQYRTQSGELATRWELEVCPFNQDHNDRSAVILQWPNGATCFRCHHDGCTGRDWQALRQLWQLPASNEITAADIVLPTQTAVADATPHLAIVRSQDVQPEPIAWLWQDRFVIGGINLCAGRGGIGKTYFLCDLVARITNALCWHPTASHCSTDESCTPRAKTTLPRLSSRACSSMLPTAAGWNTSKGCPAGPYLQLLDVIEHCDLLRDALQQRPDTVALVLDPISVLSGRHGQQQGSRRSADSRRCSLNWPRSATSPCWACTTSTRASETSPVIRSAAATPTAMLPDPSGSSPWTATIRPGG